MDLLKMCLFLRYLASGKSTTWQIQKENLFILLGFPHQQIEGLFQI